MGSSRAGCTWQDVTATRSRWARRALSYVSSFQGGRAQAGTATVRFLDEELQLVVSYGHLRPEFNISVLSPAPLCWQQGIYSPSVRLDIDQSEEPDPVSQLKNE